MKPETFTPQTPTKLNPDTITEIQETVKDLRHKLTEAKTNPILYSRDQLRIFRKRKNFLLKQLKKNGIKL